MQIFVACGLFRGFSREMVIRRRLLRQIGWSRGFEGCLQLNLDVEVKIFVSSGVGGLTEGRVAVGNI